MFSDPAGRVAVAESIPGAAPVAGALQTEAALGEIWRRVLGPKGREPGGHLLHMSVGARRVIKLVGQAEAAFGVSVPLTGAMRLGTMRAIARAIDTGVWPEPSALTMLRDGAPDRVLYLVAAGGGLILERCDLAALIAFPGQIWALQPPGLDREAEPLRDVATIARHYTTAILATHPYAVRHVFGYSFGGLVAAETARALAAAGQRPHTTGVLDSVLYEKYWPRSEWVRMAARLALRRAAELRTLSPRAAAAHLGARFPALLRRIQRRVAPIQSSAPTERSIYYIGGLAPGPQSVRDAGIVAFEDYDPAPFDLPILLVKSELGDHHACNPSAIWRRLASDLEIVISPGAHTTMIRKPHVAHLARVISSRVA